MQTNLAPEYRSSDAGQEAEAILRKCVHCGFCSATCPSYQILGDELDSPRGRIYLIKQVLEGQPPTRSTQMHLDRCLTCRSCETTCPSGVQYGHLLDIGRALVAQKVSRPLRQQMLRWVLKQGLTSPLFGLALKLGQGMCGVLPEKIRSKIPLQTHTGPHRNVWPTCQHERKVLLLAGCVQPALAPNINHATARVLDAAGMQTMIIKNAGCCGALRFHLDDMQGARVHMRRNIDAWWPYVQTGQIWALVTNASGCGVMLKDYAHVLKNDKAYADKARHISSLARDISELLPEIVAQLQGRVQPPRDVVAWHPPCTLQHGQQLRGGVERYLRTLGFDVRLAASEAHLCCGSAGTYSLLQPALANALRTRKLAHLHALKPDVIASANIGCIMHLQSVSNGTPVRHWIELLDEALVSRQVGSGNARVSFG